MTPTTFRIEYGTPWVGDKPYPWASEVGDNTVMYSGFTLTLENAWEVYVQWAMTEDRGWPEYLPLGEVASVDISAVGITDKIIWHNSEDPWPYQPVDSYLRKREYIRSSNELDLSLKLAMLLPSPEWAIEKG